jgi:hypothetical protein
VTDHGEQLREAFETHEILAPDPAAVYARVQELSRVYRRRRRGVQAAGTAVLGAGLIAGAIQLPSVLAAPAGGAGVAAPAGAPTSPVPSVAASYSQVDLDKDWAAYFAAGYGYDDAVRLAALWHTEQNIGLVKAEAGRRLLAGETLPIAPHPSPSISAAPDPAASADAAAVQAFFDAGYVWDDAVKLAALWKLSDPSDAKVAAGKKLEAGQKLPIAPKPANVAAAKESAAVNKFFAAGYTYDDAVKLATLWKLKDAYAAKVAGGEKLLAGQTLPIKP